MHRAHYTCDRQTNPTTDKKVLRSKTSRLIRTGRVVPWADGREDADRAVHNLGPATETREAEDTSAQEMRAGSLRRVQWALWASAQRARHTLKEGPVDMLADEEWPMHRTGVVWEGKHTARHSRS